MRKLLLGLVMTGLGLTRLPAQDLSNEALASFPPDTVRVEYSNPAKLRTLPNYETLRRRYIGPRLQQIETSLSELGVREADINELLLGWRPARTETELYGLASGRFSSTALREGATARGLSPTPLGGQPSYCLEAGLAATCVLLLTESHGVFGSFGVLSAVMDVRGGRAAALGARQPLAGLVGEAARSQAAIWGVAIGPAVSDWFKGWMPSQENLQLDWSRTFGEVEALLYNVQVRDKVNLNVRLDCASVDAASKLKQLLEGLRLFQQIVWQNQNPGRPNPFEVLEVTAKERTVSLSLFTAYDVIASMGGSSTVP